MPFIPLSDSFPRVSADEQAARDVDAERLISSEFEQDMPADSRAALEREYRQRFGKEVGDAEVPARAHGFIPLADAAESPPARGFVPLHGEKQERSVADTFAPAVRTARAIGQVYPVAETAANLITQGAALPVAGLAGLGAAATKAMGLTDKEPADVVHAVSDALTYQPVTDSGKHLTQAAMMPFEWLAKGGAAAGNAVLNATGSPVLATAADTAINALPMAIGPAAKVARRASSKTEGPVARVEPAISSEIAEIAGPKEIGPAAEMPQWDARTTAAARGLLNHHSQPSVELLQRVLSVPESEATAFFDAWRSGKTGDQYVSPLSAFSERIQHLGADEAALPESAEPRLAALRREGDPGLPAVDGELPELPRGRGPETAPESLVGTAERQRELRTDELPLAAAEVSGRESPNVSQGGAGRRSPEYRGSGEAQGDLPEHLSASAVETGDGRPAGAVRTEKAPWSSDIDLVRREDAEHSGLVARVGDPVEHAGGAVVSLRSRRRASIDPAQAARESIARADRILNERGSIAGWADHYNYHVNDGRLIESIRRNDDGSHTFRISDGQAARVVTVPAKDLSRYLDIMRDPAKVADVEARNASDVVLGRKVRELDDATLRRWRSMVSLSDKAQAKLEREIKRRGAFAIPNESTSLGIRIDEAAHEAATSPLNDKPHPTPSQVEAGTYAKGHFNLHGLQISIENPKGSIRAGVARDGRPWQTEMQNHYGYIRRTLSKDGDAVDVFIGDRPESTRAFVIDQIDPASGKFDEPKVILGAADEAAARRVYQANYEPGWRGLGAITQMDMGAFKEWVKAGDMKKPIGLPRVAGKVVTEFDDAALARLSSSKSLSAEAHAKVQAEIDRRAPAPESAAAAMPEDGTVSSFVPGASYTGFIDDTPRTAHANVDVPTSSSTPGRTAARRDPIRREDILIPFVKALDTGLYEGRVKSKRMMGFFRPKNEEVRIKRHADLETAAHELAHLIDSRVPEIRRAWQSDKALAKELKSISYDAGKVYEGFAEGVRLWMTQPEVAKAKAPLFSKWFEDFTKRSEYGPAILKARDGMTEWFGQDAIDRARSKIGDHRPISDALDGVWDNWRQSIVDDLHGVYRMEREKTGGIAPAGAYETARLARASHSIADGALRFGAPVRKPDGSFAWKGKGLEEILKPVAKNLDDALLYFVGRSARELMTQGREHLFTTDEIDGLLKLKRPEFDQAFREYQAWNKGVLDFAEAHGVINPEARALWQRTQYLPFHRVGQPGGFKGKPGDWSGVKALTGGTENIRDILGNMTSNAAQLIDKAVKNEARQKIAALAEEVKGGGKFMTKIPPESRPIKVDSKQAIDALMKTLGADSSSMSPAVAEAIKNLRRDLENAPAMLELMQTGVPPAGGNVVAVLKGGKPVWYEVADRTLYRALSSIDRPLQSAVVKWLSLPKRIGQMAITLTPDFMLANIARDTIMGSVMSRAGFRPVIDSLQGMRLRLTNDPLYKEFIANGGGMSSMFLDETRFRAKLEKFYERQGIDYRTVLDAPAKIGNFLETLADSFEMSTRLGEYKRAIDAGEHPRHAAYLGRDVSTDFAMKGDSQAAGFMYDTVMFLRPALVSWDRLYRGVAHDANKMAIAAKTGTLATMSMALYLLNKDDPRYQDLPDWDRDTNWHFFVGDQHFRYPKIWEIGAVASIAERTAEKVMAEDPQGLGKDFARILGAAFNLNWKPQILAPLYEQAINRNDFTKTPIETPGMEDLQPFLRAKPTTSETLKVAGMATRDLPEALQVNPVRAEALLRGYFNTWAMYGLMLTDKAMFGDKLPESRTDQLPVVRRFYSQEPPPHTKFETEFYDMLGQAKRLHGTMRELDRLGRSDLADAKEKEPLAAEARPLERAAKNLSGINKDMLMVRRSDASPAEKRRQLDELTVERNALLKAAVQDSKGAQKKAGP